MKIKNTLQREAGLYHNIDPAKYFAMEYAVKGDTKYRIPSKSMLTEFSKNPEKWKSAPPFVKSSAMTMGSLLDCLLLTPQNVGREFIIKPSDCPRRPTEQQLKMEVAKRTPAAKKSIEFWEDFEKQSEGKEIITNVDMDNAKKGVKKLMKHPKCSKIIEQSDNQVVCVADYKGFLVKGMFDLVPHKDSQWGDCIVDLKRTSGFAPKQFSGIIRQFSYHWQAALYRWLYKQVTGEYREQWKFMISDSEDPYGCGLLTMHEDDIKRGEDEVFAALDHYIDCVESNEWENPYNPHKDDLVLKSFSNLFSD